MLGTPRAANPYLVQEDAVEERERLILEHLPQVKLIARRIHERLPESVNLDEELVNLTTYQQAFNASARMIQATKDLFDVLTQLI